MSKRLFRAVVAALALGGVGVTAGVAAIIDQQNTVNSTFTVTFLPSLSQSFTPTLDSIDFARFVLSNTDTSPATYKVELREGPTPDGALLGTTGAQPVAIAPATPPGEPITVDGAQPVQFDFPSSVALVPGNVYTLRVVLVSGFGSFFTRTGLNDPYPGGTAYDVAPQPSLDYVFAEGIVPEPASVAGVMIGLGVMAGWRGSRRRTG